MSSRTEFTTLAMLERMLLICYVTQFKIDQNKNAMGTNMAAGNQQKHLSLSFATKA